MKRSIVLLVLAAALPAAATAQGYAHWNDLRTSSLLPGGFVTLRVEEAQGPGITHALIYAQDGLQEVPLWFVEDGPSTIEATVPGPAAGRRAYGLRRLEGDALDLLAVQVSDGTAPAPDDLTRLRLDPLGDESFGLTHLDLIECRVGRDGTRLYACLENAGGGFPVSQGLAFYSYLLGIKDPAVADPDTLFALIHTVTAAGIIEPGLYQINGTGVDDLVKIGEITATVVAGENALLLSCLLADLEANAIFQSWYDPLDPRIDVAGFTQKITIFGGAQEADRTAGGIWHLREVALEPGPNQAPELADLALPEPGLGGCVSVVYSDADGHCPVIAEIVFDEDETYPLRPQTLDYAAPVVYCSGPDLPPLVAGDWTRATARFSDDLVQIVEITATIAGVPGWPEAPALGLGPNPFRERVEVAFTLECAQEVRLDVHDAAGRRVHTQPAGTLAPGSHRLRWDARDAAGRLQPGGVYFLRLHGAQFDVVRPARRVP